MVHIPARYYDAQVRLFTTRDTLLDQEPYQYCEHDPIHYSDPSGHEGSQGGPYQSLNEQLREMARRSQERTKVQLRGGGPGPEDQPKD
ncbi:MAG: hypothetical protein H7145_21790 [Akkermansiaceae bacterium]|nr:hypothetical protein [Armatimonadota bacterium]